MIQLTRLNNACLAVNSDLIKYVEQAPDTVITLLNGEKLIVRETTAEVIELVRAFRQSIFAGQQRLTSVLNGSILHPSQGWSGQAEAVEERERG